jgi:hypothetical protein
LFSIAVGFGDGCVDFEELLRIVPVPWSRVFSLVFEFECAECAEADVEGFNVSALGEVVVYQILIDVEDVEGLLQRFEGHLYWHLYILHETVAEVLGVLSGIADLK